VAGQVIAGELIAVAQASEDALELVVREHARLVYRIAYSALRNHHDAEDVTQETFVRVLRWRKKLDSVRDLKAWLARIAGRVAIDRVRKKSTVPLNDVEEGGDYAKTTSGDAEQSLLSAEMSNLIGRMITGLPTQLREVIALSTIQQLSPAEIGEVLDISQAAVRSRPFRAREILKQKIAALLEGKHES